MRSGGAERSPPMDGREPEVSIANIDDASGSVTAARLAQITRPNSTSPFANH